MLESSHPCWLWVEICGQGPSSCGKVYLATFSCKPPVTFFFRWHPVDHTPGPRQRWIFFRCQCLSQRTAMEGERWVNRTEAWFRLWVLTWSRKTSRSSWKRHRAWRELIKRVKSTIDPKSMETKTFFFLIPGRPCSDLRSIFSTWGDAVIFLWQSFFSDESSRCADRQQWLQFKGSCRAPFCCSAERCAENCRRVWPPSIS